MPKPKKTKEELLSSAGAGYRQGIDLINAAKKMIELGQTDTALTLLDGHIRWLTEMSDSALNKVISSIAAIEGKNKDHKPPPNAPPIRDTHMGTPYVPPMSLNKEQETRNKKQEKTGTVLQLPPGFPSSHDTFDAVLSGGVSEVLAKWRTAWKKWKRTEPSIGNLEYRIASENMDYLKEPDIDKAFKWFLTDENAKEFGGHSFKAFCKDPAKWLGKYRDSLPKDRRDEIAKLETQQRAEQEKILKRDFEIDPEQDKPLDFSTLI